MTFGITHPQPKWAAAGRQNFVLLLSHELIPCVHIAHREQVLVQGNICGSGRGGNLWLEGLTHDLNLLGNEH